MRPAYSSPSRCETSREACIRVAMQVLGRFKADGCWTAVQESNADGSKVRVVYKQINRKFRRSGGRAS
jgi:hypothetical protein